MAVYISDFQTYTKQINLPFNQRMASGNFDLGDSACPSIVFAAHMHWPQLRVPLCSQEDLGTNPPKTLNTFIIFLCLSWSTEEWTEKQEE